MSSTPVFWFTVLISALCIQAFSCHPTFSEQHESSDESGHTNFVHKRQSVDQPEQGQEFISDEENPHQPQMEFGNFASQPEQNADFFPQELMQKRQIHFNPPPQPEMDPAFAESEEDLPAEAKTKRQGWSTWIQSLDNDCQCSKIYNPVCGLDRKTYSNPCELACAGQIQMHAGSCNPILRSSGYRRSGAMDGEPCNCPKIYKPVCGLDGKTYSNRCELICAGQTQMHSGICTPTDE